MAKLTANIEEIAKKQTRIELKENNMSQICRRHYATALST